jgi:hypothetical protein
MVTPEMATAAINANETFNQSLNFVLIERTPRYWNRHLPASVRTTKKVYHDADPTKRIGQTYNSRIVAVSAKSKHFQVFCWFPNIKKSTFGGHRPPNVLSNSWN